MPQALGREGTDQRARRRDKGQCFGGDAEAVALFVPDEPEQAGRIIDEGLGMEDTHQALLQVLQAMPVITQFAPVLPIQAQGQGVDGEITPGQVTGQEAGAHGRKGAGVVIGLGAGGDEVKGMAAGTGQEPLRRPEAGVGRHASAVLRSQCPGKSNGIALDHQVKVGGGLAQQQVTHEPADQVERHLARRRHVCNLAQELYLFKWQAPVESEFRIVQCIRHGWYFDYIAKKRE